MILRYVLISWSRKDGTSWYAIIARIATSVLTSNGAVLLRYMYNLSAPTVYVDISSVRVCVYVCVCMCAPGCSEQCYATRLFISRCFSKQQVCKQNA